MENIEQTIHETVLQIAQQKSAAITEVNSEQKLNADLGFSSLDLAQLVAILEMKLNADPFAKLVSITSVRTVGDLCEAYEKYFNQTEAEADNQPSFQQSQTRAQMRRRVQQAER
jgi:acyl carrier protein